MLSRTLNFSRHNLWEWIEPATFYYRATWMSIKTGDRFEMGVARSVLALARGVTLLPRPGDRPILRAKKIVDTNSERSIIKLPLTS
jgi:hypothetical protein